MSINILEIPPEFLRFRNQRHDHRIVRCSTHERPFVANTCDEIQVTTLDRDNSFGYCYRSIKGEFISCNDSGLDVILDEDKYNKYLADKAVEKMLE